MNDAVDARCWPRTRMGEALEAVARAGGYAPRAVALPAVPDAVVPGSGRIGAWLEQAAEVLGLEAEPVEVTYPEVAQVLRDGGPAVMLVHGPPGTDVTVLAIVRGGRRTVHVIGPDLVVHALDLEAVRARICHVLETPIGFEVDRLLRNAGVADPRRARAAMVRGRLTETRVTEAWMVRLPPGAGFLAQARRAGLGRKLAAMTLTHGAEYGLMLLAWWLVGHGALSGRLDRAWLTAWALALGTSMTLRLFGAWIGGRFAIDAGALVKQRLLVGALRLSPEEIRHQGAGELLGRVIESEAIESLALSGGLAGVLALIDVVIAATVLVAGAGGLFHALLLFVWVAAVFALSGRYWRDLRAWTSARLAMTHDLVERMGGHATRLAQEQPARWHDGEDEALAHYQGLSRRLDRTVALMIAGVPRGWLLTGILGLAPAFASGHTAPGALAVGLGGIMLAQGALGKLLSGLPQLAATAVAWQQVGPLFHAATRETDGPPSAMALDLAGSARAKDDDGAAPGRTLLDARDVVFRYRPQGEPVLQGATLQVYAGDKLLLEGPSGGGKSTLGAVLTGLREPESGLLLLDGLDQHSQGAARWRRRVACAPQFHENHILTGTFAFNLLMGRRWPARRGDMEDAEQICRELDLGPLLERMPAGLLQMVGETGWQLSHGERSRLYIARALLQNADVLVLDESFAALDPETLQRALTCVLSRAPTVLVIAHP